MDIWKPDWEEVRGYYENTQQPYQAEFERVFEEQRFEKPHFVFPYSSTMELSFGKLPIHISYAEHLGIQHRTQHELIDILNNH
jgi:hypothetical protein